MTYSRIDLIGQNGNEGLHYEEDKDKIIKALKEEIIQLKKEIYILKTDNELKKQVIDNNTIG